MDELAVAHVDAHMGGYIAVVLEEHQITGLKVAAVHGGAIVQLGRGAVRQGYAQLAVHIHGEAGAVEAAGGRAAIDIGHAHVLVRQTDGGAAGDTGGNLAGAVTAGIGGIVLGGQGAAQRHILLGHIAAGAITAHGVPAVALVQDGNGRSLGQSGQNSGGGVGLTA